MNISNYGRDLLASWEGMKNYIYFDSANLPTIGIGHLLIKKEFESKTVMISNKYVNILNGISDEQVIELMSQDLQRFIANVNDKVTVKLNQNQFDALVSFSFNVGISAFNKSTLLRKLNNEEYKEVPLQLRRWNKAGGKVITGLVNRREKEILLWNK
jgi:lysozyme